MNNAAGTETRLHSRCVCRRRPREAVSKHRARHHRAGQRADGPAAVLAAAAGAAQFTGPSGGRLGFCGHIHRDGRTDHMVEIIKYIKHIFILFVFLHGSWQTCSRRALSANMFFTRQVRTLQLGNHGGRDARAAALNRVCI